MKTNYDAEAHIVNQTAAVGGQYLWMCNTCGKLWFEQQEDPGPRRGEGTNWPVSCDECLGRRAGIHAGPSRTCTDGPIWGNPPQRVEMWKITEWDLPNGMIARYVQDNKPVSRQLHSLEIITESDPLAVTIEVFNAILHSHNYQQLENFKRNRPGASR